ncbi:hypothetical protein ABIB40_001684 [Pedobacter sp. UYP30]|uniref:DUF3298 and DUF4163 domain-containing protein n=1 Tax=Pedobacter sp. UYP30 TaxID=1756400 RepID=UPI0033934469
MKTNLTLLAIMLAFGFTAAAQNKALPKSFYKHFSGTIAGQPVSVQLQSIAETVTGSYAYTKHNEPIDLVFRKDSSKVNLLVFSEGLNDDESITGLPIWKCYYRNGKITGKWYNGNRTKTYPILLKEDYPVGVTQFNIITYDTTAVYSPKAKKSSNYDISGAFPVAIDNKANWLNTEIKKILDVDTSLSFENALKKMQDSNIADYRENAGYDSTNLNLQTHWDDEKNITVQYNENGYVVLQLEGYEYSGGAHGNPWLANYCFDIVHQRKMVLKDLVTADSLTLQRLLESQFRKDNNLKPTDSLTSILFENNLPPNKNFLFTQSGIEFTYIPYEVAPYVEGILSILIPFEKLKKYLVPEFEKRMKLKLNR